MSQRGLLFRMLFSSQKELTGQSYFKVIHQYCIVQKLRCLKYECLLSECSVFRHKILHLLPLQNTFICIQLAFSDSYYICTTVSLIHSSLYTYVYIHIERSKLFCRSVHILVGVTCVLVLPKRNYADKLSVMSALLQIHFLYFVWALVNRNLRNYEFQALSCINVEKLCRQVQILLQIITNSSLNPCQRHSSLSYYF